MAADVKGAEAQIADRLLSAKFPVLLVEYVGRHAESFGHLVALAETDRRRRLRHQHARLNFPNRHKLNP